MNTKNNKKACELFSKMPLDLRQACEDLEQYCRGSRKVEFLETAKAHLNKYIQRPLGTVTYTQVEVSIMFDSYERLDSDIREIILGILNALQEYTSVFRTRVFLQGAINGIQLEIFKNVNKEAYHAYYILAYNLRKAITDLLIASKLEKEDSLSFLFDACIRIRVLIESHQEHIALSTEEASSLFDVYEDCEYSSIIKKIITLSVVPVPSVFENSLIFVFNLIYTKIDSMVQDADDDFIKLSCEDFSDVIDASPIVKKVFLSLFALLILENTSKEITALKNLKDEITDALQYKELYRLKYPHIPFMYFILDKFKYSDYRILAFDIVTSLYEADYSNKNVRGMFEFIEDRIGDYIEEKEKDEMIKHSPYVFYLSIF